VAEINLTPRLAAKLLTQSYLSQVSIAGQPSTHAWVKGNPRDMGIDPDFLQFNPEFEFLGNNGKNLGGPVMSVLNSDAARQVWEWVLADPEARAWLDGAADQWGMRVNPAYATTAEANSAGAAFADPVPSNFPKSDPYCYQGKPYRSTATGGSIVPPPLCGADWFPYAQGLREAARATRIAFDGARANQNADAIDANTAWKRGGPQTQGSKTFLSLTDSASAFQYGIQMARLSRAGDNGADRAFITPDSAGLIAGVGAMAPKDEPTVLEVDPMAAAPAAYPLTALTYAAIAPLSLDAQARAEYAGFVDYAAGPGQVPGLELGQLPRGFAPLPESLRMQATAAAKSIRELVAAPDPAGGGPSPTAANADAGSAAGGSTAASGSPRSASGSTAAGSGPAPTSPASSLPLVTATGPLSADTPLTRALTPVVALARSRFVLPALVAVLLLSALGALEITKRPRREPGRRQQSTGYLLTTKPVRRVRKETSVDG